MSKQKKASTLDYSVLVRKDHIEEAHVAETNARGLWVGVTSYNFKEHYHRNKHIFKDSLMMVVERDRKVFDAIAKEAVKYADAFVKKGDFSCEVLKLIEQAGQPAPNRYWAPFIGYVHADICGLASTIMNNIDFHEMLDKFAYGHTLMNNASLELTMQRRVDPPGTARNAITNIIPQVFIDSGQWQVPTVVVHEYRGLNGSNMINGRIDLKRRDPLAKRIANRPELDLTALVA